MTQPSVPPPLAPPPPPPPQSHGGGVQVRCAGCRMILTVAPGLVDFVCPTCQMHQMLPPELMSRVHNSPQQKNTQQPQVPAHGIDPSKIQLPCANCKAILNVPHGLARFACPQCGVDLAVDLTKVKQFFSVPPTRPLPPPEEVNEVFSHYTFSCDLSVLCSLFGEPLGISSFHQFSVWLFLIIREKGRENYVK